MDPWKIANTSPDEKQRLFSWIEKQKQGLNPEKWGFQVSEISPVTSITKYGVVHLDEIRFELEDMTWKVEQFNDEGNRCSFTVGHSSWNIETAEIPSDRWGNRATFGNLHRIVEGCYPIYYCDDTYVDTDFSFWEKILEKYDNWPGLYDSGPSSVDDLRIDEIVQFLIEDKPEIGGASVQDKLSTVGERLKSNGTTNEWLFILTNEPPESYFWEQVFEEFLNRYPPDTYLV